MSTRRLIPELAGGIVFRKSISIHASPQKVWQALTIPELVEKYHLAPLKKLDEKPGGQIIYGTPEEDMISGSIIRYEPGALLEYTFQFGSSSHEATEDDPVTIVSYEITPCEDGVELKLTHSGFPTENQTYENIKGGWPFILEGLKTLLEGDHSLPDGSSISISG